MPSPIQGADPLNPYNQKGLKNYNPGLLSGIDPNAQDPTSQFGYLTSNPEILSRTLSDSLGYGGTKYGMDPYSQYIQNRMLSAATLGTFLSPSADPQDQLGSARAYELGMNNLPARAAQLRAMSGDVGNANAGNIPQGAALNPNWISAMDVARNPQDAFRLVQATVAGLPQPLQDALAGMGQWLQRIYNDQQGTRGGTPQSFFQWLVGDKDLGTPAWGRPFTTPTG